MNDRFSDEELRAAYVPKARTKRARGQDCPSPEALLAALRGEGEEAERLRVLDHALQCDACRPELALLHGVSGASGAPAGRLPLSWQRFIPVAAAASIVLVALVGLNQFLNREGVLRGSGSSDVVLVAPASNATISADSTRFLWHSVPGAIRYTLEAAAADGTIIASSETTDTTLVVKLVPANHGELRWWIKASMDDGSERRSEPRVLRLK
jgi:hypothetical protein